MIAPLLLLIALAAPHTTAAIPDLDAISALDERFVRDLRDKNIGDVLTLYAPDAVFVNPDGTQATGQGLRKLYAQVIAAFDSDLHLTRTILKRHGNTAVEEGAYTETLGHRDTGKLDHLQGTYRFSFRRIADGRWLVTRMEWH